MRNIGRRSWLGLNTLASVASASGHSRRSSLGGSRESIRARFFPDVRLKAHTGQELHFYDDLMRDKVVVINFMYATCEKICPTIMTNLARVQKLLRDRVGRDIFMYSFTLKPKLDTPEVLAEYAHHHGIGPGWLLLTGNPRDLELLRVKLGFTDPDPVRDADTTNHIGNIRYGNERLQLWAACPGLADPEWIAKSILWVTEDSPKTAVKS